MGIPTGEKKIMSGYECMECGAEAPTRNVTHKFGCHGQRFAGYIVPIVRPVPVNIMAVL